MEKARFIRISTILLGLLSPTVAFGQAQVPVEGIPVAAQMLNVEEMNENARLQLAWTPTVNAGFSRFRYELTYDRFASEENQTPAELIRFEDVDFGGENEGDQISGVRTIVYIRPQNILRAGELPSEGGVDDAMRDIYVKVYPTNGEFDSLQYSTGVWTFLYDTRAPDPPQALTVLPGEGRLEVVWSASSSADLESYHIVYCPNVTGLTVDTSTLAGTSSVGGVLPCDEPEVSNIIDRDFSSESVSDGLKIGVEAALAVRSVDEFGNVGRLSNVVLGTPIEVDDFWELYQAEGGNEEGGFCFVATAANGSYAHPTVRVLRWFRDTILAPTPVGRSLVLAYYRWSPPVAARLMDDTALASSARVAILVGAFLAFIVIAMVLIGLTTILAGFARHLRRLLIVSAVVLVLPATAEAKRPGSDIDAFGLGFEFKGGPYLPDLGNSGGGTESNSAFSDVYGNNPNELFTLGMEMHFYRGIGTAGVGATFGFMQFVGRSINASTREVSRDTTVFNIAPLALVGVYRFDWLAEQIPFPFVPYVKGGLAYYLWWVTTGTGNVARVENVNDPANDRIGRGGKWGLTGTLGMSILLNVFEPSSAQSLYAATGVRGTYLFAELQANKIDGFGADGFDLSDVTWNLGLFIEM